MTQECYQTVNGLCGSECIFKDPNKLSYENVIPRHVGERLFKAVHHQQEGVKTEFAIFNKLNEFKDVS